MGNSISVLLVAAVALAAADEKQISVQLTGGTDAAMPFAHQARAMADKLFRGTAVRLDWCQNEKKCLHWQERIVLTLETRAPSTLPYGALAAARMYEGRNVRIFMDRLQRLTDKSRLPALLGHVIAHEIGHILQGIDRHAPHGIMKAQWTGADIHTMDSTGLAFEPLDINLIHQGLAWRNSILARSAKPEALR